MQKNKKAVLYTVLLCGIFSGLSIFAFAQLPKSYTSFDLQAGLPDKNIKAITQDKYGYLWVGTENGLVRFDGKHFTTFTDSKTLAKLPSDNITDIQNIDSNHLAIVTTNGLSILDLRKMMSQNLSIPKGPIKYDRKVNLVRKFYSDVNGDLYLVTRSGFYHFNKERELLFRYDDYTTNESDIPMSFGQYSLWVDKENIVMSGKKGTYKYNTKSKKIALVTPTDNSFLFFSLIRNIKNPTSYHVLQKEKGHYLFLNYKSDSLIYVDEANRSIYYCKTGFTNIESRFTWRSNFFVLSDSLFLLSGKFNGVYTLKLNRKRRILQIDTAGYFQNSKCNAVFSDRHKKLWVGFADGLKHEKSSQINLQVNDVINSHPTQTTSAPLLQLAVTEKYIYGASMQSGGLIQFNKSTLAYEKTIPLKFPAFGNKSLFAIENWNNRAIISGSDAGLFLYNEKTSKSELINMPGWNSARNWIADLFTDSKGNLWITSNKHGGCYRWSPNDKAPNWVSLDTALTKKMNEIYHIAEDKQGNIWMAGKGIARYNMQKKNVDLYIEHFSEDLSKSNSVEAIVIDEANNIWLGNGASGLGLYTPATKNIIYFTKASGLPDDNITGLKFQNGHIWVICKNGIAKINCKTREISTICTIKDVYYQNFYSNTLIFDSLSFFYTGSGASVIKFEADNKSYKNTSPELIFVYASPGNDSTIWFPEKGITLSWEKRNITLFYNAINFEDADYQRYSYRTTINGETSRWFNQEDQRRLILNDLNIGTTKVEVKISSPKNAWPEKIISYTIKVKAPWWKTIWFKVFCLFAALGILYSLVNYRYNQTKKVNKIRDNISKDLHDEIGATLSGIALYSHLVKKDLANNKVDAVNHSISIIQNSATEMVSKLNDMVWLINPIQESFDDIIVKLKEYTQNMCMVKNIAPSIQVQGSTASYKPNIETRKNIYLFCKEAVNNAVKHSNADTLLLQFALLHNMLEITIKDDGDGFDLEIVKKGNGLDNLQKRAADIGAQLFVKSAPRKGCSISLKITQRGIA